MTISTRLAAILALLVLGLAGTSVPAAGPDEAVPAAHERVEAAARRAGAAGAKAEQWAEEREALLNEARQLIYDTEATRFALSRQQAYIAREKADIVALTERIRTALATRHGLEPVMEALYAELAGAIAADPPFARDERRTRLASVRRTLDDPDALAGDKLGRLLEALRIEAGFSLDVEAEDAVMDVHGAPMALTLLRVGRLALLRAPASGKWVERYDSVARAWTRLDGADARETARAVQISRKQRVAELVVLPVGSLDQLPAADGEAQ